MADWTRLDALLDAAAGSFAVVVANLAGGLRYQRLADRVAPAASLIKVAIALTIDRYAERGVLDFNDTFTLSDDQRVEGDGSVDCAAAGTIWRCEQLIHHMLHESDNTASNILIGWLADHGLEMAVVTETARELGAINTRLQRQFMDFAAARAGRDNLTTAADMVRLFGVLANRTDPRAQRLLDSLVDSAVPEKLVAGVPPGTRVPHKTGEVPGVEHDAGIVYAPFGTYLIAVLGTEIADTEAAYQTTAAISRLVYTAMLEEHHGA